MIDMDPAGSTATSVGAIEDCARINKNGVQDADEDAVDTVFADVVAINVPASHPMIAFEVNLRHGPDIVVDGANFAMMLEANAGSDIIVTDVYQTGPETTSLAADDAGQPLNATDALWILRRIVGQHLPLPGCSSEDMDCDGDRDAVDALWILRWIEYRPVHQHEPCPDIGTELQ